VGVLSSKFPLFFKLFANWEQTSQRLWLALQWGLKKLYRAGPVGLADEEGAIILAGGIIGCLSTMGNESALYMRIPLKNTPQHRMGAVHKRIEGLVLRQHDGSVKVFDTTAVSKEMFL
jgi:hypothetical protein